MKQLYIFTTTSAVITSDMTGLTAGDAGKIGFYHLDAPTTGIASTAALSKDFGFVIARGANKMPLRFPEVNFKSLQVTKSTYSNDTEGATFSVTLTVPSPTAGTSYSVTLSKKGVVFNERNNWTFEHTATSTDTATTIAKALAVAINASSEGSGLKVATTPSSGDITISATTMGPDYAVGIHNIPIKTSTTVTAGKPAMLDSEYMKDLASRCAAGKGFEYLAEDGKEIYPGYPESIPDDKGFTMWTLRFAVPRVSAKQRDEVVWQTVHIACPQSTKKSDITLLDTLLGITAPSSSED